MTYFSLNIQGLKSLQFKEVLKIIVIIFAVQTVLVLLHSRLYFSFSPCMLLFLYKKNINDKFLIKEEYSPIFINFSIFLVVFIANTFPENDWVLALDIGYLLTYTFLINREIRRQREPSGYTNSKNIISIFNYFSIFSAIVLTLRIYERNFKLNFDLDLYVIFIGILFLCFIFGLLFLNTFQKAIKEDEICSEDSEQQLLDEYKLRYQKHYLECDNPLSKEIIEFYETSNLYLNADFNLYDLAQVLGCSRAELSDVLNREMKTGFYSLTGVYRIEYAKKILLKKENFTIEALMVQCGFHSKSTFNKYFKEFVGLKPSVYRKLHSKLKQS